MRRARAEATPAESVAAPAVGEGDGAERRASAARRGGVRALSFAVLCLASLAMLSLGVFPTRTYLDQREALASSQATLEAVEQRNAALAREVEALSAPEAIERVAREEYGMVRPGEEPYRILPPSLPPLEIPDAWPFQKLDDRFREGAGR